MFRPGLGFGQRYHVDRHGQLTLKQLRLSVLNEMHTNSYIGPRLLTLLPDDSFTDVNFRNSSQYCKVSFKLGAKNRRSGVSAFCALFHNLRTRSMQSRLSNLESRAMNHGVPL